MKIKTITHLKTPGTFDIPYGYVPYYYFDAFNLLYKFENSLRLFVYAVLKSEYEENWANQKIHKDKEGTITSIYRRRKKELENYGHIGELPNIPMLYLTLDELVEIILNDSFRRLFNRNFPASIDGVYKTRLKELIILRNNLVHFRKVTEEDFKLLIHNLERLASPIGEYIENLIRSNKYKKLKPNENDEWYSNWISVSLKTKKHSLLKLEKSICKKWIKLSLEVETLTIEVAERIYLFNIKFENVFAALKKMLPYTLYFYKWIECIRDPEHKEPSAKGIDLCVHYLQFQKHFENIFYNFSELIDKIEDEFSCVSEEKKEVVRMSESLKYLELRFQDFDFHDEDKIPRYDFVEDWSHYSFHNPNFDMLMDESPWVR